MTSSQRGALRQAGGRCWGYWELTFLTQKKSKEKTAENKVNEQEFSKETRAVERVIQEDVAAGDTGLFP